MALKLPKSKRISNHESVSEKPTILRPSYSPVFWNNFCNFVWYSCSFKDNQRIHYVTSSICSHHNSETFFFICIYHVINTFFTSGNNDFRAFRISKKSSFISIEDPFGVCYYTITFNNSIGAGRSGSISVSSGLKNSVGLSGLTKNFLVFRYASMVLFQHAN